MNQTIETILNRRSVRAYEAKQIARDELDKILACGDAGPSGANNRGWRFVIVQDSAFKQKLVKSGIPFYKKWLEKMPQSFKDMRTNFDESSDPFYYNAPTIIFVISKGMTADLDCPMVCQNMMLAARSLGIGSCWVYVGQLALQDPEIRAEFNLVEAEKVYGPIILGYPLGNNFPEPPQFTTAPIMWK